MKIEEGKYYFTQSGLKVGPMRHGDDPKTYPGDFWVAPGALRTWWESGTIYEYPGSSDDLVSEAPSPIQSPIRTKTVTEIVPGIYGALQVAKVYDDGVNLYANPGKWSADDITDAIATLTAIRDALQGQDK